MVILCATLLYQRQVLLSVRQLSAVPLPCPGLALRLNDESLGLVVVKFLRLSSRCLIVGLFLSAEEIGAPYRIESRTPGGEHAESICLALVIATVPVVERLADRHRIRPARAALDLPDDSREIRKR